MAKHKMLYPDELAKTVYSVFTTEQGKELLSYLEDNYLKVSSFSKDPIEMAFKEGQRSIVLDFIHDMEKVNER